MKIKVTADSTCDLPAQLIAEYNVELLPLYIIRDGVSLKDGADISTGDVFAYTKRTGKLCGTAAVSVGDYMDVWGQLLTGYDAIVHVAFSSKLSASCGNAKLAALELGNVYVVDSLNLSTGYGHLVIEAAKMAAAGNAPEAIIAEIERLRPLVDVSFVLDTLDFLRKGGRCTAIQALGANLLGLKPCIEVQDGSMGVAKKYRGRIEQAYIQYITDRLKDRDDIDLRRVFITDSGVSEDCRARLREAVLACQPFEEVYSNLSGCVISGHCGPWCMGVLYFHKG